MTKKPTWFTETYYLQQKLAHLQATKPEGHWTLRSLGQALEADGLTPLQHFELYGIGEGLSPNPYFNVIEYLQAKVNQLNVNNTPIPDGADRWTTELVQQAISTSGLTAWTHFQQFGWRENVNPSNDFDVSAYLEAKVAQLRAGGSTAPDGKAWTVDSVAAAFLAINIDPLDHYYSYGRAEDIAVTPVPADERVVPDEGPDVKPDPSPAPDVNPDPGPIPGVTLTLTTGTDILSPSASGATQRTTDSNDTINANDSTLNPDDQIDGGAGSDTLNVDMSGNFGGFSSSGYLKNIETVNLTNKSSSGWQFVASGVTSVKNYTLTELAGNVSLKDLANTDAAISIHDTLGDVTVGLLVNGAGGNADALNVGLNSLGTAATAGVAQKTVTVTADNIETLNLKTTGDNVVALNGNNLKAITVEGKGSITTTLVSSIEQFNASDYTGTVHVNLRNSSVNSVLTGAGNDVITANIANLKLNAEINGGAGTNTLVLTGADSSGSNLYYKMSNIETISLGAALSSVHAFNFSADQVSGITTINVNNLQGTATLTKMGAGDLDFNLDDHSQTKRTVISDHTGATNIHAIASSTDPIVTTVHLNESKSITLNVDSNTAYNGEISANSASTITVSGHVNSAHIQAAQATSAVLNTTGASSLKLNAGGLTELTTTVAAGDRLDLTGSTLTGLTSLTANAGANSILTLTAKLTEIQSIQLSGTKSAGGTVILGDLGSGSLKQDINLNANGLKSLTIGTIKTDIDKSVTATAGMIADGNVQLGDITVADKAGLHTGTINVMIGGSTVSDVELDAVTLGKLTANTVTVNAAKTSVKTGSIEFVIDADTATLAGALISSNRVEITATTKAVVTTGAAADVINIIGASSANTTAEFTVETGDGSDSVSVTAGAGLTVVTITDFIAGTDNAVNFGGRSLSASITNKASAALYLSQLKKIEVNAADVEVITNGVVEYAGATYGIVSADSHCGNADIVVQLAEITNIDKNFVTHYFFVG